MVEKSTGEAIDALIPERLEGVMFSRRDVLSGDLSGVSSVDVSGVYDQRRQ
ncbi:hypothetical protein [Rothia nasimurium]|uniref:hypothetical protein n=1 Tax=Rothia nasimurium TaxID=85336 RepID=UPI001F38D1FB|nr:hypothetical protein [Rothia nasimurium]